MPTTYFLQERASRLFHDIINDPSLIGFWPLNEVGATIYDRCTKNNINGTVAGNPVAGKSLGNGAYGLDFDGAGDYLDFGDPSGINFERTDAFSFVLITNANTSGADTLIGKLNASSIGWYFNHETGTGMNMRLLSSSGTIRVRSTTALTLGTSAMVGMSYSGSSTAAGVAIYKDGVALSLSVLTDTLAANTIQNSASVLVGRNGTASPEEYNGDIGMIAVFNAAMTAVDHRRWAWLAGLL